MDSWKQRQSDRGDFAIIYKEDITGMNFADVHLEDLYECDEFVSVANKIVLLYMNREGNRKQVVCNEGFEIESGSDVSQCRNGAWTPKPTCICSLGVYHSTPLYEAPLSKIPSPTTHVATIAPVKCSCITTLCCRDALRCVNMVCNNCKKVAGANGVDCVLI